MGAGAVTVCLLAASLLGVHASNTKGEDVATGDENGGVKVSLRLLALLVPKPSQQPSQMMCLSQSLMKGQPVNL